jgi:parallel beta-helix repeat protein
VSKDHFITLIFVFFLVGMVAFVNQIERVEAASPTIHIKSDGSIDPPTANITSVDNVTYTLTSDIVTDFSTIIVERDNIVLDGAGHTVQTVNHWNGIELSGRNNVTVKDFRITYCYHGIFLDATTWITIENCTITGDTNAVTNGYSGGPTNFTCVNNNITGNTNGLNIGSVYDGVISGNIVQQCDYGLVLQGGVNVTVKDNLISGNTWGIWPLGSGSNISIMDNTISNNYCGANINGGNDTTRVLYHNRFLNNTIHAQTPVGGIVCSWDNGYPSGGNYWSGYISPDLFSGQYQNVTGGDGIGDNPYVIDANNRDNYPFMLLSICNVSQIPTGGTLLPTDQVMVNATVTHLYAVERVMLNYTIANDTGTFTVSVDMTNAEGDVWNATIPAYPAGTNVTYIIIGQDDMGNVISSQQQGYTLSYQVIPEFSSIVLLLTLAVLTLLVAVITRLSFPRNQRNDSRFP